MIALGASERRARTADATSSCRCRFRRCAARPYPAPRSPGRSRRDPPRTSRHARAPARNHAYRGPMPSDGGPDGLRRANDAGQRFRCQGENRGLVENVAHAGFHAGLGDRLEPFPGNAGILILVLDLPAALLHGNRAAACGALAPERDERIAPASQATGEVTGRTVAGIEMLMKHPERWRVHETMLPGKFLEYRIAFVPEQRISLAVHRMYMGAGGMPMRFLVSAGRYLRHVGVHRPIGK